MFLLSLSVCLLFHLLAVTLIGLLWQCFLEILTCFLERSLLDKWYVVDRHRCHKAAKFGVFVNEDHSKLLLLYILVT